MNNIDEMPAKCKSCPYWEPREYPYICQDIEPKPAENGNINAGIAENPQNRPTDGDYLISQRAAINAVNDVLAEYIPTFRPWQDGIPLECTLKIKALPPAPAIPLAWIESYIKTCELFDLRVNVPAEKIIKTMVKIWEQENPDGKKGGDNGKT